MEPHTGGRRASARSNAIKREPASAFMGEFLAAPPKSPAEICDRMLDDIIPSIKAGSVFLIQHTERQQHKRVQKGYRKKLDLYSHPPSSSFAIENI